MLTTARKRKRHSASTRSSSRKVIISVCTGTQKPIRHDKGGGEFHIPQKQTVTTSKNMEEVVVKVLAVVVSCCTA